MHVCMHVHPYMCLLRSMRALSLTKIPWSSSVEEPSSPSSILQKRNVVNVNTTGLDVNNDFLAYRWTKVRYVPE